MKKRYLTLIFIGLSLTGNALQQTVYLTLDDGPLPESKCIDSLVRKDQIKVNIFAVGSNLASKTGRENYTLYKSNPYIKIFNHSYSHANDHYKKYYQDADAVLKDFQKNDSLLTPFFPIVRMPGRNMWRVGGRSRNDINSGIDAPNLLAASGYTVIGWDVAWLQDSLTKEPIINAFTLANIIDRRLQNGSTFKKGHLVLLLHDQMFCSVIMVDELKKLIGEINRRHLQLAYLDSYPLF
ncbi:MAG TPA: polysaccharide deacetylase family protein [Pseudosphingobacterium sp.]|nr:polysaccharide deacetylase family protein [Pseudosphingobacterium sp.]